MYGFDPATFSLWDWCLYGFGAYCCGGLMIFWFRFQGGEARAKSGGPKDVEKYNRSLRGFPNSVYAKMLGKRPLQ